MPADLWSTLSHNISATNVDVEQIKCHGEAKNQCEVNNINKIEQIWQSWPHFIRLLYGTLGKESVTKVRQFSRDRGSRALD